MRSLSGKNILRLFVVLVLLVTAGAVFADNTGDFTDFSRIAPFEPQSLWLMKQAKAIIETYHVDSASQDITEEDLVYGALKGMVAAWGDPYTRFVDPESLKDEEIDMKGEYGGLGIYIGQRDGMIVVISPIEDTPADRVGLKPKDQIVKIEDEMILGWDIHDVVKRLRGRPGPNSRNRVVKAFKEFSTWPGRIRCLTRTPFPATWEEALISSRNPFCLTISAMASRAFLG